MDNKLQKEKEIPNMEKSKQLLGIISHKSKDMVTIFLKYTLKKIELHVSNLQTEAQKYSTCNEKSWLIYQIDISCLNTLFIYSLFFMNSDTKY